MRSIRAFTTCTNQVAPCEIRLLHLDSPPPPRDRSTDPFARHAPFLHQQPTLHFTQPTSIEHPTATNAPPGPPSNTYPMQAILPSTTCTCPPPIDLPALHQSHQAPHPNNPPSHQQCHATYFRTPTTPPRSVIPLSSSCPLLLLSRRSHPRRLS